MRLAVSPPVYHITNRRDAQRTKRLLAYADSRLRAKNFCFFFVQSFLLFNLAPFSPSVVSVRLGDPLASVHHEEHDVAVGYGLFGFLEHDLRHAGVGRA